MIISSKYLSSCFSIFLLIAVFSDNASGQEVSGYKLSRSFSIKSGGGWDYIAINNHRIFVSHGSQVNVLDETSGDSIGVIAKTDGVHGIAFCDALNKGYTSNGKSNSVTVFDLKTLASAGTTGVGGVYSGKVAPLAGPASALFAKIKADEPFTLDSGTGRGSVANPTAPTATPAPSASSGTTDAAAPIAGVLGQTAADYTCSKVNN